MSRAVVILSGGMDSSTLVFWAVNEGFEVFPLTLNYKQRHVKEIECARAVCKELGVPHKVINISTISELLQGSALTTPTVDVPEGHYEAESMKQTVVPARNTILLSLGLGYAVSLKASYLLYGAHSGDHHIYADCRPIFIDAMRIVAKLCDERPIELLAPFADIDKTGILEIGGQLNVPYEKTWTCYVGKEKACGRCGSCTERREAFKKAGMEDPLEYED